MAYYIEHSGMGGFLNPPNDAEHTYCVTDGKGRKRGFMSLRYALKCEWVDEETKASIRTVLTANPPQYTDEWERKAYTYFRNCYSPDGETRNISDCVISRDGSIPVERHLAYLLVRSFFPDAKPRMDLL